MDMEIALYQQLMEKSLKIWNQMEDESSLDDEQPLEFEEELEHQVLNPIDEDLLVPTDGPPPASQRAFQDEYNELQVDRANNYARSLLYGYGVLATELEKGVKARDIAACRSFDGEAMQQVIFRILCAIPTAMVHELLCGNMALAEIQNRSGISDTIKDWDAHDKDDSHCRQKPVIYYRILVDGNGRPPTCTQWLKALSYLEKYKLNDEIAACIDTEVPGWKEERTRGGKRRYEMSKKRKVLEKFCSALRRRIESIPQYERDEPLEPPMGYIGFTTDNRKRQKTHDGHKGASNSLMCLVESVCRRYLHKNDEAEGAAFRMRHFIIHVINSEVDAGIAEIILTEATRCYAVEGRGFVDHGAGASVKCGKIKTSDWNWINGWTLVHTPLKASVAAENERIDKQRKLRDICQAAKEQRAQDKRGVNEEETEQFRLRGYMRKAQHKSTQRLAQETLHEILNLIETEWRYKMGLWDWFKNLHGDMTDPVGATQEQLDKCNKMDYKLRAYRQAI